MTESDHIQNSLSIQNDVFHECACHYHNQPHTILCDACSQQAKHLDYRYTVWKDSGKTFSKNVMDELAVSGQAKCHDWFSSQI